MFPEIKGTFLGVPIIRTTIFWGLYWGTLILGNYRLEQGKIGTPFSTRNAEPAPCHFSGCNPDP